MATATETKSGKIIFQCNCGLTSTISPPVSEDSDECTVTTSFKKENKKQEIKDDGTDTAGTDGKKKETEEKPVVKKRFFGNLTT